MPAPKQLWLLAGGNGAGKSTFHRLFLQPRGVQFVNADLIAKALNPSDPEGSSYDASVIAGHIREELLEHGISFCFETVFSHPGKIDFVAYAKSLGYEIILVMIHLQTPELNQARVAQRVSEGGHHVPTEKILSRLPRTLANVRAALPLANQARLLDNSSRDRPFQAIATLRDGQLEDCADPLPTWAMELLTDYLAQNP
ncbi:MAG: zeta toxin family protein [Aquisalimonadaceae bacterium]